MSHSSKKYGVLIALIIIGALVVSYGFHRIENQQHKQNEFSKVLHVLIVKQAALESAQHSNTTTQLQRQRASDLVLCNAINRFRPPPPKLDCHQIEAEAIQSASAEGH